MANKKRAAESGAEWTLTRLVVRTVVLAAVAGGVAAGYSLTLKNQYTARSGLLLSPSPVNLPESREQSVNPDVKPASQISFMMAKPLSEPVYETLLKNDDIVSQLRAKYVTLLKENGEENPKIALEDIRRATEVKTRILAKTSNSVEYQPVIELAFTSSIPKIAAAMATEWASLGIKLGEQLNEKGIEGTIEFLKGRFDEASQDLEAKEKELQELESKYDVDGMTDRLKALQLFLTEYEIQEIELAAEVARVQGEAEQLTTDIAGVPEKVTLQKAPPDAAYWMLDAAQGAPDTSKVLATEEVNWLYVSLRENKANLDSMLAGLLRKQELVVKQLEETRREILDLQGTLAEYKRLRGGLTRETQTFQDQYKRLAVNYEGARIAAAEATPDLKIAYAAAVPEKVVAPHRSLIVFAAALFAALIAPLHFFLTLSLRTYATHLGLTKGGVAE